jgi:hypothetical protein
MPPPQPPRVVGPLSKDKGANSGSGGNNRGQGNPANPDVSGNSNSPCLIASPKLPVVGSVGGGCLFSKTNARALIGGAIVGAGGLLFIGGAVILVAAGFNKSGALDKAATAAAVIPGGQIAAAGLRAAGSTSRGRSGRPGGRAASERRQMRQLGEPRENRELRTGRGAVRETPAGTRRRKAETGTTTKPATREEAGF